MFPWRASLFHPLIALLLVTNYVATPGLCADDPGMISFTYPQATNNRFTVGDTIEIAWLFRSPGQHAFNLDLVLPNGTLIGSIAKGVRTAGTTTVNAGAFNYTIPNQLNNRTILTSNYQFTIHSTNFLSAFDPNPSRSPVFFVGTNVSCHHQFRSAAGNSPTGCTENDPLPRPLPTGSSIRTRDGAVSFAALVVALSFATVLLG